MAAIPTASSAVKAAIEIIPAIGRPQSWRVIPVLNSGRLLPSAGDIALVEIMRALEAPGYRAPVGGEVFSTELWKLPPVEIGRIAGDNLRALLQQVR
jgi:sugar phosphate isomerase/epimerase